MKGNGESMECPDEMHMKKKEQQSFL